MARKKPPPDPLPSSEGPILVLLSRDRELGKTIEEAAGSEWTIIGHSVDRLNSLIRVPNVGLVVFDDQLVAASDHGWALTEIQRCASKASIVYVANQHDHENERQARLRGVLFYTSKPLVPVEVSLILKRAVRLHNGR